VSNFVRLFELQSNIGREMKLPLSFYKKKLVSSLHPFKSTSLFKLSGAVIIFSTMLVWAFLLLVIFAEVFLRNVFVKRKKNLQKIIIIVTRSMHFLVFNRFKIYLIVHIEKCVQRSQNIEIKF